MRKQNPQKRPSVREIFTCKSFLEIARRTGSEIQEKRKQLYKELGILDLYYRNMRFKKPKMTQCGMSPDEVDACS